MVCTIGISVKGDSYIGAQDVFPAKHLKFHVWSDDFHRPLPDPDPYPTHHAQSKDFLEGGKGVLERTREGCNRDRPRVWQEDVEDGVFLFFSFSTRHVRVHAAHNDAQRAGVAGRKVPKFPSSQNSIVESLLVQTKWS